MRNSDSPLKLMDFECGESTYNLDPKITYLNSSCHSAIAQNIKAKYHRNMTGYTFNIHACPANFTMGVLEDFRDCLALECRVWGGGTPTARHNKQCNTKAQRIDEN
jgi:hypothetical protein